ncbi:iron complex transport system substrate-binding protein [Aminobacter lissarensis]|uniref:Iron complex transport system substrate-binding protein n=1 Tax=Aminobacter carboxidus TaxID=376165 RepID=A0A8E1WH10_9HYPH|nr:ABC transporter substrate-binding protein [Aminobacter lissarensis]MBB6468183.1 iron complex transport system substrate-binding protein [Aminobacter lissarensis]
MPTNRLGYARFRAWLPALAGLAAVSGSSVPAAAQPPKRVVSMNVCTDQLAMLVAGERQLHSVSHLASDPNTSVLADRARGLAVNHGLAEEVFLMHPDLVLAGTYTTRTTVALLRRLGVRVEEFAPDSSIADIRTNILRMGEVLEQRERSAELVAELEHGLAELGKGGASHKTVATYYANSYTSGAGTLVDEIVKLSGLVNVADRLGLSGTARLPLEMLVLSKPDLVAGGGEDYGAPALAQENFVHPAYRAVAKQGRAVAVPSRYTICGAPFTLEAARLLRDAASQLDKGEAK